MTERAEGTEEDEIRHELLAGLSGRVIEIGSGTGPNFRFYPDAVSELVAVEPEDYLRARAEEAAGHAGRPIRVVDALADELPFEDRSFDAAVAAQVLCSVPSQAAALTELRRVLRPGGELRFYEHVIARQPRYASFQRLAGRVTSPPGRRLPSGPRHGPGDRGGQLHDRALPALRLPQLAAGPARGAADPRRRSGLSLFGLA